MGGYANNQFVGGGSSSVATVTQQSPGVREREPGLIFFAFRLVAAV